MKKPCVIVSKYDYNKFIKANCNIIFYHHD